MGSGSSVCQKPEAIVYRPLALKDKAVSLFRQPGRRLSVSCSPSTSFHRCKLRALALKISRDIENDTLVSVHHLQSKFHNLILQYTVYPNERLFFRYHASGVPDSRRNGLGDTPRDPEGQIDDTHKILRRSSFNTGVVLQ